MSKSARRNKTLSPPEKMKKDLRYLDTIEIAYMSIDMNIRSEKGDDYIDETTRVKKEPKNVPSYKDKKVETKYISKCNGTMIPTGKAYNLIGIDVDNKEETIDKWFEKREEYDEFTTLTLKTMNGGYHYYFRLNDNQQQELEELNFKAMNDALFGLKIDVKYTNQVLFGPCAIEVEGDEGVTFFRTYSITKYVEPIEIPQFIYKELIKNIKALQIQKNPTKKTTQKKTTQKKKKKDEVIVSEEEEEEKTERSEEDDRLVNYLVCLKKERWDEYESWFKLGAVIFNEGGSFELFDEFSKKSDKYDLKSCQLKWKEYKKSADKLAGIGTLIKMAQEDNIVEYKQAIKRDKKRQMYNIVKNGITDIAAAKLFQSCFEKNFIYDEINGDWYCLNNYNIWQKDSEGLEVQKRIATTLMSMLLKYKKTDYIGDPRNEDEGKRWKATIKYLSMQKSQKAIVQELVLFFKSKTAFEKMDNINNHIFAFNNGVYDLKENKFRLPFPEELVSATCGYDYSEPNEEAKKDIHEILNSMFANEEDKDYVLYTVAQCLAGSGTLEKFYLWRGQGRNGKGVLRDLIKNTFGGYFDSMEIDYLTKAQNQSATAADEVIAKKKNCRIVMSTEPDAAASLRTCKIKQLTGGDPVSCRALYGGQFQYVPKFKLFIQSNYDLSFTGSNTKAMLERLEVQEFPFSFVEDPIAENEKPADLTLKERIQDECYKSTFFHILLEYYLKLQQNKKRIKLPKTVSDQTKIFFIGSDPFSPWFDACIEKVKNEKAYVSSDNLKKAFQKFYDNNISMSRQDFKAALIGKGLKPSCLDGRIVWRNIILKETPQKNEPDFSNVDFTN